MLEAIPEGPFWIKVVWVVLGGLITFLLVPYLKSKRDQAKAEATMDDMASMKLLLDELKSFLFDEAANIAEQRFPKMAKDIINKKISGPATIRAELEVWGRDLKGRAKQYFATRGIDVVGAVGDAYLDKAIRNVADSVSPFPGAQTALTMFEKEWSNKLVKYGVDWVRERFLGDDEDGE